MDSLPKPNTQAISWFYGEYQKDGLILDPKYQRNPIWSLGQKCFLIDSLISGAPIPQVFLNILSRGTGVNRRTVYEVVDGQQRLRAILEYMSDEYVLVKTTAKAYPVSSAYAPHIGKTYSNLPQSLQDQIWNYPIAVQELRGWDDVQIRSLFRRLNYVNERLNKQELRHSQYFGEFTECVEKLTDHDLWETFGLFTRRDSARMRDVEFVSELLVVVVDGVQDQLDLDSYYAKFDVSFPRRRHFEITFQATINSLSTIAEYISESRFHKKADFYALFAAALRINVQTGDSNDLKKTVIPLRRLERELEKSPEDMGDVAARYHATVVEGANKIAKRTERTAILEDLLSDRLL